MRRYTINNYNNEILIEIAIYLQDLKYKPDNTGLYTFECNSRIQNPISSIFFSNKGRYTHVKKTPLLLYVSTLPFLSPLLPDVPQREVGKRVPCVRVVTSTSKNETKGTSLSLSSHLFPRTRENVDTHEYGGRVSCEGRV